MTCFQYPDQVGDCIFFWYLIELRWQEAPMTAQAVCCVLSHPACQAQGITSQGACELWLCGRGLWSKKRVYKHTWVCCKAETNLGDVNRLLSHLWEGHKEHMTVLLGVWSESIIVFCVASMCHVRPCVPNLGSTQQYFAFYGFDLVQFSKIPETNKQDTLHTSQKKTQPNKKPG